MSEDGLSDYFDEPNMEIQIETLMGTCFDMRVSSNDTVQDIKQRIQRVEGIPAGQQSLIYQSKELKDSLKLCDAGVRNGATIKLVLSMRGGPISTRRMSSTCEHHHMLKELKELLENTRDEMGDKLSPGSKVSVLVFKEGDIINLLRVIENDDGSYSPYSEKPISPPSKSTKNHTYMSMFQKLVEDDDMMTKMSNLRRKMEDVTIRRNTRLNKTDDDKKDEKFEERMFGESSKMQENRRDKVSYKLLTDYNSEVSDVSNDLKIFEKSLDDDNHSETEEIALKDKHRTKPMRLQKTRNSGKSLYSETKGAYSRTKETYARMHKKNKETKNRMSDLCSRDRKVDETNEPFLKPIFKQTPAELPKRSATPTVAELAILEDDKDDLCIPLSEPLNVSARNRVHLTRLVLSEPSDRPKSSPDSIELEENAQDLFEIHESASERIKHSATYKVGLVQRRQSVDYGCESLENQSKVKQDLGDYNYCNNSDFEVCSSNFYHMSQLTAVPPQYAPKQDNLYDYYFSDSARSPLYGRKSKSDDPNSLFTRRSDDYNSARLPALPKLTESTTNKSDKYSFLTDCSSIQRLKNDCGGDGGLLNDSLFSSTDDSLEELYGYYNLGCANDLLEEKVVKDVRIPKKKVEVLPPVIKKKARCNQCNKRLNITNIYNCRCGQIFCSQHRYSEVHRCSYDYKSEGRKILEQQNPVVTAEKLNRI